MSKMLRKGLRDRPLTRYDAHLHDIETKMENGFNFINDLISRATSESDAIRIIMSKTDVPDTYQSMCFGTIFGVLTSTDRETYFKYIRIFQQIHHISTSTSLTPMNYIALEVFWQVSDTCRTNFYSLLRECLNWKMNKVEIVVANTMKSFLEFGNINTRYLCLLNIIKILKNFSNYLLQETRDSLFVTASIITVLTHYYIELKQCPLEYKDEAKKLIIQFLEYIFSTYYNNVQLLAGKELIFTVHLLSGTPEFSNIWKNMVLNPSQLHSQAMGVHDLFRRPMETFCNVQAVPNSVNKRMNFLMNQPIETSKVQWKSILNELQHSPDGNLRGILIRYALYLPLSQAPNPADQTHFIEIRAKAIVHLLCTCKGRENEPINFHEFQIAKLALIYEFLGYDLLTGPPPYSLTIAWRVLHILVTTNQLIANSVFDFLINIVQNMYPALTPMFVTSITKCIESIQRTFGQNARISDVIDNTKLEKSIRESFKELLPGLSGYFISSKQSQQQSTESPKPIVASQISVAEVLDQPQKKSLKREASSDGEIIKKKKMKKVVKAATPTTKSASFSSTTDTVTLWKLAGWDGSLGDTIDAHLLPKLPSNIKDSIKSLEQLVKKEKDNNDIIDVMDELFSAILSNTDLLEEEEDLRDAISDSLLVIFKKFLLDKKFYYTKNEKDWDITQIFNHPFYNIFKQLYIHDETTLLFSIIQGMASKYPPIGYLLLFYVCSSKIQDKTEIPKDDYNAVYIEFCGDKDVQIKISQDMEACAIDDYELFKYLLPKIFQIFPKYTEGSEHIIRVICTHCFSDVILELLTNLTCENCIIFKRETFTTCALSSLEWEAFQQIYFWQLVRAEGVHFDWVSPILPKIDYVKHHEAAIHSLILTRTYGEPNMTMVRQLFSRKPGDLFALNALKILCQEEADAQKLAQNISILLKKALDNGDIAINSSKTKSVGKKPISVEAILSHLNELRKRTLAKPLGQTERMLKDVADALNDVKASADCADICTQFAELFSTVEIISGSGRTLRKNRQRGGYEELQEPKTYKRKRIISESEEDE